MLSRINYERAISIPYYKREFRLDRMLDLLDRLGNPQDRLKIIHVAGTKGKGSTSAMIAAALSAAGYRAGLYTSPHVDRLEERLMVDGQPCPEEIFGNLVERVRPIVEQMDVQSGRPYAPELGVTYFEVITAIALLHFVAVGADVAVIEVGLGGRLDSTNVCQPLISVITSISLDHTQQLGNTLTEIASEKAGIIKPGIPVISGVIDEEPRRVIADIAQQHRCRLLQLGVDFTCQYRSPSGLDRTESITNAKLDFENHMRGSLQNMTDVDVGLLGRHQAMNAAVALAVLTELRSQGWHLPEVAIRRGLANVRLPARLEIVARRPTVVVDAAHNVASIQALLDTLKESFLASRRLLVFAATQEKDVRGMLRLLLPHFEAVILTRYLNNPRCMDLEELGLLVAELSTMPRFICIDPATAWRKACELVTEEHLMCVTGSFFLAAEMRAEIAQNPLKLSKKTIVL
ncbi:MAG TPA: folylpolyglutamate synthase/dihydrofolate synthase family protein [Pirellulales bacterium]|nr:folylpolyglutamate synthase/dihydrofolate synthase family protein [Pirellulales bacterium]